MLNFDNSTEENHFARSSFIQKLVQRADHSLTASPKLTKMISKRIIQFWDNLNRLPTDVSACIETWKKTEVRGFETLLFDKQQAGSFIHQKLGLRYKSAFDMCYHPAMQSDFFRLCYIFAEGGCYVDADDEYNGTQIEHLFNDERLKIQPLCYDKAIHVMVPPSLFLEPGANSPDWIFYFNNNPLIAGSGHPLIARALDQATSYLEKSQTYGLPEIQSTTGPGNLSKSIFDSATRDNKIEQQLLVLTNWEDIAKNRWELSYRNDARNWRLSNCQNYTE